MTHTAHHRSYGASVSIKNFFSHKSHTAVRKWRFEHNINIPILSFFQLQNLCVQKLTLVKIFTSIFFWLLALTSAYSAFPCLSLSSTFAFVFGLCLQQLHPWSVTEEVISYISYIYISSYWSVFAWWKLVLLLQLKFHWNGMYRKGQTFYIQKTFSLLLFLNLFIHWISNYTV